jgi:hypothetical protein
MILSRFVSWFLFEDDPGTNRRGIKSSKVCVILFVFPICDLKFEMLVRVYIISNCNFSKGISKGSCGPLDKLFSFQFTPYSIESHLYIFNRSVFIEIKLIDTCYPVVAVKVWDRSPMVNNIPFIGVWNVDD